jgi:hypothetical protein
MLTARVLKPLACGCTIAERVDCTTGKRGVGDAGNPQRARQASEVLKMAKEKGRAVPTGFEFSEADLEYVGYDINGVPMDGRMQAAIKQAFEQDGGKVRL